MLSASFVGLSEGTQGTRETLNIARRIVRREKRNMIIRGAAEQLIAALPSKASYQEVMALHAYVRDAIRYTHDATDTEHLVVPSTLIYSQQGDCLSKATLLAALLESIGFRTRFFAIGQSSDEFSHVWIEVLLGPRNTESWIALETTERWPMGKKPRLDLYPAHMIVNNA